MLMLLLLLMMMMMGMVTVTATAMVIVRVATLVSDNVYKDHVHDHGLLDTGNDI